MEGYDMPLAQGEIKPSLMFGDWLFGSLFAFRKCAPLPHCLWSKKRLLSLHWRLQQLPHSPHSLIYSKFGHHHDTVHQLDIAVPQDLLCWVQMPDIQLCRAQGQQRTRTKRGHWSTSVPVEGHISMRSIWWSIHPLLVLQPRWTFVNLQLLVLFSLNPKQGSKSPSSSDTEMPSLPPDYISSQRKTADISLLMKDKGQHNKVGPSLTWKFLE